MVSAALRVVIGEDDVLLREGMVRLLGESGFDVVAQTGDADDLLRKTLAHRPDVAVVDVQMPPRREDDGLIAALEVRRRLPGTGVLAKDSQPAELTAAVRTLAAGGALLPPRTTRRLITELINATPSAPR